MYKGDSSFDLTQSPVRPCHLLVVLVIILKRDCRIGPDAKTLYLPDVLISLCRILVYFLFSGNETGALSIASLNSQTWYHSGVVPCNYARFILEPLCGLLKIKQSRKKMVNRKNDHMI